MAFSTARREANDYYEFYCDTVDDIADLPTDCQVGSTALVIEGALVYMLNNQGEWVSLLA